MIRKPRETTKHESTRLIKVRRAILLILGAMLCTAAGIGIGMNIVDPSPKEAPGTSGASNPDDEVKEDENSGDGPDPKKPLPKNLVSSDQFDEAPEDYVNIDQCRALILQVTGKKVAIGEEEVRAQCDGLEQNDRRKAYEKIIDDWCIVDPDIQQDVLDLVITKGLTQVEESEYINTNGKKSYRLEFTSSDDESGQTLFMEEKPGCEWFDKEEAERQTEEAQRKMAEEMSRTIENWNIEAFTDDLETEGVLGELNGIVESMKEIQNAIRNGNLKKASRWMCRLMLELDMLEDLPRETEGPLEKAFDRHKDMFVHFVLGQWEQFISSQGIDKEECINDWIRQGLGNE